MDRKISRGVFADVWRAFLHRNFRDAAEVRDLLGCSTSTAHRWWSDGGKPSAEILDDVRDHPEYGAAWQREKATHLARLQRVSAP